MTQSVFPKEYLSRMQKMLDWEGEAFFAALEKEPRKALRFNPLKVLEPAELSASLSLTKNVPWESMGLYYDEAFAAGKHPFHEAGVYYIQEPSAMAPVSYLDVRENERILDLCAAPGGKSTQIAGKMQGTGLLVSNEIVEKRAKILSENIERMGISNAIVTSESPDSLSVHFPSYFDKILVDAPCSGEGMFRKNNEAISEWSPENVKLCANRQDDILDSADIMLKPGGRLVYSTCTFAPDEDEGTVVRFLSKHPEYTLLEVNKYEGMEGGRTEYLKYAAGEDAVCSDTENETEGIDLSRTIRIWPHKVEGEGHFLAVFQKGSLEDAGDTRDNVTSASGGVQKGLGDKEIAPFLDFQKNTLKDIYYDNSNSVFIKFGDNLYRLPKDAPNLKGLKVMRPGLHLGTFLKNRFEPAHALSHSLLMTNAVNVYNMPADSPETTMYLNGQALRPMIFTETEAETGAESAGLRINNPDSPWILVCAEGFSLGWAKYAGGTLKNHYPKGLRIQIG